MIENDASCSLEPVHRNRYSFTIIDIILERYARLGELNGDLQVVVITFNTLRRESQDVALLDPLDGLRRSAVKAFPL